jgi:DNA replication protein DnaC
VGKTTLAQNLGLRALEGRHTVRFSTLPAALADLLFHIVSRRHEKRSVVLTTNLAYKKWGTVFHDASCLGALVDRFAQHCHTLDIDADSWRHKEAQQRSRAKKTPPTQDA